MLFTIQRDPHSSELADVVLGSAEGSESDLLAELGEVGVGEEGHVSEQLVAAVGLWGVEGVGGVADVLGAVEDAEGEPRQEVPTAQVPRHGSDREARLGWKTKLLKLIVRALGGGGPELSWHEGGSSREATAGDSLRDRES